MIKQMLFLISLTSLAMYSMEKNTKEILRLPHQNIIKQIENHKNQDRTRSESKDLTKILAAQLLEQLYKDGLLCP